MRLLNCFILTVLIFAGVMLLVVIRDLTNPHKEIEVVTEPTYITVPKDINDPWNYEAKVETAWNLGIYKDFVTQEQFEERYFKP